MSESRVQKFTTLQMACLVMSIVSLVRGCLGIVLSFLYLASYGMADITAGASVSWREASSSVPACWR